VAALLRASELDSQAVELHLTLGSLFRKRGEVDRALRIHEALAQRSQLTSEQLQRAHFELAQDYLKAGLMDRAEALFQELSLRGAHVIPALEGLIAIYEQAHDWQHAIDANERLQAASGQPRHAITAQYWCELAEEARQRKDAPEALRLARRALDRQADCVRASLILGRVHEEAGDPQAAIKVLQRVPEQDPRFLPEIVEPLFRVSQAAGDLDDFIDFMRDAEPDKPPSAAVLVQARLMRENGMNPARYLAEAFAANPSWALLEQLLDTIQPPPDDSMAHAMTSLREALRAAAAGRIRYRCTNCGLAPGLLFWQCPACKRWGSTVPADDRLAPAKA
jgi:lipopolysaccharide biosynthesis regulator YciM